MRLHVPQTHVLKVYVERINVLKAINVRIVNLDQHDQLETIQVDQILSVIQHYVNWTNMFKTMNVWIVQLVSNALHSAEQHQMMENANALQIYVERTNVFKTMNVWIVQLDQHAQLATMQVEVIQNVSLIGVTIDAMAESWMGCATTQPSMKNNVMQGTIAIKYPRPSANLASGVQ